MRSLNRQSGLCLLGLHIGTGSSPLIYYIQTTYTIGVLAKIIDVCGCLYVYLDIGTVRF